MKHGVNKMKGKMYNKYIVHNDIFTITTSIRSMSHANEYICCRSVNKCILIKIPGSNRF